MLILAAAHLVLVALALVTLALLATQPMLAQRWATQARMGLALTGQKLIPKPWMLLAALMPPLALALWGLPRLV